MHLYKQIHPSWAPSPTQLGSQSLKSLQHWRGGGGLLPPRTQGDRRISRPFSLQQRGFHAQRPCGGTSPQLPWQTLSSPHPVLSLLPWSFSPLFLWPLNVPPSKAIPDLGTSQGPSHSLGVRKAGQLPGSVCRASPWLLAKGLIAV